MNDYFSSEGRLQHIEKVKKGLQRLRSSGKKLGPPLILNDKMIEKIKKLKEEGHLNKDIMRRLNLKESTFYKGLREIDQHNTGHLQKFPQSMIDND